MRLTAEDVEAAFVATAASQVNGEPFDWQGLAERINARLTDEAVHRAIPLRRDPERSDA